MSTSPAYLGRYTNTAEHVNLTFVRTRTCTSALYTSTYAQLEPEFGCSRIVATLGLSLFVVGLGLGPMVMSPLSEVSAHLSK